LFYFCTFYFFRSIFINFTLLCALLCTSICFAEVNKNEIESEAFTNQMMGSHNTTLPDPVKAQQDTALLSGSLTAKEQNGAAQSFGPLAPSTISLSVQNATMEEIAMALAKMSGKNIIADAKIAERVTLQLENVSLDTALDALTASRNLTYADIGSVILITKEDTVKKQSAGFYTFPLNYARAEDLQKPLATVLNSGKLTAEPASNSLLFNGSHSEARKIKEALQTLDIATQLVTLEAKILSINKSGEKNLGIQWNWDRLPQYSTGNYDTEAGDKTEDSNQGHLRFWRSTRAQFRFSALLNALISSGKAKVLATPSMITIPGKEASIFIGSHIPVVTEKHNNGQSSYSTEYVDAGIKLQFRPIVSRDGYITSSVHTEVSTPTLISELKNYRINSRTADTNVRMRNGETLVIGGLISEEEQKQLQQIPFLSKLPLLGALFKNHYSSKNKTEVIMLLTPYLSDAGTSPAIYRERESFFHNTEASVKRTSAQSGKTKNAA